MSVYAVDFDGTLCEDAWPDIGEPKQKIIDTCIRLRENGHKLIFWSCREGEMMAQAIVWCAEHGLHFDAINANLPERIEQYGTNPRKIGADYYLDDKNIILTEVHNDKT